ncbi:Dynein heavy chain 1, axonemal [Oopsacas minuta]|uniref:Dynein heavy chain 1, axonemal n=1 Tax=Oopsacas minuta TaxID=111878 RepID=A0AAV7JLM0_9METZ|nr:Dynein heavy chain 1, axonemal [Oopsacas minuta]
MSSKQFSIEHALDMMEQEWKLKLFETIKHKNTDTVLLIPGENVVQLLQDNIAMLQSMSSSPYSEMFQSRITNWEKKLSLLQEVIENWQLCQRKCLYLEPIFTSDDIKKQLPLETKQYKDTERIWNAIMKSAKANPKIIQLCPDYKLLDSLKECITLLEQIEKGLNEYLETKRRAFPRFYFLSNDDLLHILSKTNSPVSVQLSKMFDIAKVTYQKDFRITEMWSKEGEKVPLCEAFYPKGGVEVWMKELERVMKLSIRENIKHALESYNKTPRNEWVTSWPGQVVLAGCQAYWTIQVANAIKKNSLDKYCKQLTAQLEDLIQLVRGKPTLLQRSTLTALIPIEVHARDIVENLRQKGVRDITDFEWICQLRSYWEDDLILRIINAEFRYGYEYLGNSARLVITPLTDRCYISLTGAMHLKLGGSPCGPAGTGKTETVKDLAKALGIQCIVINCSDQLDYLGMAKILTGIASAGVWSCFDEFNRIDIEVMSVVAQQITIIQNSKMQELDKFCFANTELSLKNSCGFFLTMNPGYKGRTELPDNLKALFRPIAMMIPDYALIAEVLLYSFGFSKANLLAKKIVTTFKLSSEQLSRQCHYDFGMRAVKSVLQLAGDIRRSHPRMKEDQILLRALRASNTPKFLKDDLKLFNSLLSDIFPGVNDESAICRELESEVRKCALKQGLQDVDEFVYKCIQLYEITLLRHGVVLVGETASAKTKCYQVLAAALSNLKGRTSQNGQLYQEVVTYCLNPKTVTLSDLYGEYNVFTNEWRDGLLPNLMKQSTAVDTSIKKWFVFDGPVDAIWIESLNTVLDDNKILCLANGEIIPLTADMSILFETQDLEVASPATVSRCGVVWLEPMGIDPLIDSWIQKINNDKSLRNIHPYMPALNKLICKFLKPSIVFVRTQIKEIVTTVDANLVASFLKMLDCLFKPFLIKKGEVISEGKVSILGDLIESWFIFSLIWTIGATCDRIGRVLFDKYVRRIMKGEEFMLIFPPEGLVYDYRLDDAGTSLMEKVNEGWVIVREGPVRWVTWTHDLSPYKVDPYMRYSDILVPTQDTIRFSYMIQLLLANNNPVLCVGHTGTGKTQYAMDTLRKMPVDYLSHSVNFSAHTSVNQTVDFIDSKLERKSVTVSGPPLGKKSIIFIDDLNLPEKERYGAQPPIELIRQWMDHGGWYDMKAVGVFKNILDINFICAMGPPGGGRNTLTHRLLRHFNFLSFPELDDSCKATIFSSILGAWLNVCPNLQINRDELKDKLTSCTISIFSTILTQLLPTPAKCHYAFNLRDLSRVFHGIIMASPDKIESIQDVVKLWYHECCRVFQDRLVCNEDKDWLGDKMKEHVSDQGWSGFISDNLMFGCINKDNKTYTEIRDHDKLPAVLQEYLDDYNGVNTSKLDLVFFRDTIQHVCRISRIISMPQGNALLLGTSGTGRQSLTRLASHINGYACVQIEMSRLYGVKEWREAVKSVLMRSGIENMASILLFSVPERANELFIEYLNNLLCTGDIPGLYSPQDMTVIENSMKVVVKTDMFGEYIKRVRNNCHFVICMNPEVDLFRSLVRKFPNLVNCCTIDWFSEWSREALRSVANTRLQSISEVRCTDGLVEVCVDMYHAVLQASVEYKAELTHVSYIEFLRLFEGIFSGKMSELVAERNHVKGGLGKLVSTGEIISGLQTEGGKAQRVEELMRLIQDETARWKCLISCLDKKLENIIGDVLLASGAVAYFGSFTDTFRHSLSQTWKSKFTERGVAYSDNSSLVNILYCDVMAKECRLSDLTRDNISVDNAVIMKFSKLWPLFVDPQGQANHWIKSFERENSLQVVKLTDKEYLRKLENAVQFGKPCLLENVGEELDPVLGCILTRKTFIQSGSVVIKLGDKIIPYHEDFRLYITTKLPNPRYTQEVAVINSSLTPRRLEEQLFKFLLRKELPDIENTRNCLAEDKAKLKKELKEIEDRVLYKLSNIVGDIIDDGELIDVLQGSKMKYEEIMENVAISDKNDTAITTAHSLYTPVLVRARILFFCVKDLVTIDPMYQYSIDWFFRIFLSCLAGAEKRGVVADRIAQINEYLTYNLYSNVCRSLFEKHKLLFSFLLTSRILMNEGIICPDELEYFISGGGVISKQIPNPAPDWVNGRAWNEILSIQSLGKFSTFASAFVETSKDFKHIFDSNTPHKEELPGKWSHLNSFQKLLLLRCIRPDKLTDAIQCYVADNVGQRFVDPQTSDLRLVFKDSTPTSPLIFILSSGTDPSAELYRFAAEMKFTDKLLCVSLGQGQGPMAAKKMKEGMENGKWVFLQDCHLCPSWMPTLERIIKQIDEDKVNKDFRLWLSSMPCEKFPVSILQNGCKLTLETPKGIKANLLKSYTNMSDELLNVCSKKREFKYLLFSLCLFHGVIVERKRFGSLGLNIPYAFADSDLKMSISQLQMFLQEYPATPFKILRYTAGEANYGGRVTDCWDRRCVLSILNDLYTENALKENYKFDKSGIYHQLPPNTNLSSYLEYIADLPTVESPEIFGLHENANIKYSHNQAVQLLDGLMSIQRVTSTKSVTSRKTVVQFISERILEKIPAQFRIDDVTKKYPIKYEESLNTVLIQEVTRYNTLISTIVDSLTTLQKALNGMVVLSRELEDVCISLYENSVPKSWAAKGYLSLKPLGAWLEDLVERLKFIQGWINYGNPNVFWFPGFFFPQAFLTGTLQNFARKTMAPIDTLSFCYKLISHEVTESPENGCYISGLYLEGARWCNETNELIESRPNQLYTEVPIISIVPVSNNSRTEPSVYHCPLYKTLERAGVLSTTGHSTNFVTAIQLPTKMPEQHWVKRGVAMLCALDY